MPRGDNLPRFGEKAEQMRRRARQIKEANARRARIARKAEVTGQADA